MKTRVQIVSIDRDYIVLQSGMNAAQFPILEAKRIAKADDIDLPAVFRNVFVYLRTAGVDLSDKDAMNTALQGVDFQA